MFVRGINEFESKFKLFDRLNSLLFNVWRGKAAETYKNGDIARITNEWRNYSSQVRSLAEEVNRLYRELDNKYHEIERLGHDISNICLNPTINNCAIWEAYGEDPVYDCEGNRSHDERTPTVRFVAKRGQEEFVAPRHIGSHYKNYVTLERNL